MIPSHRPHFIVPREQKIRQNNVRQILIPHFPERFPARQIAAGPRTSRALPLPVRTGHCVDADRGCDRYLATKSAASASSALAPPPIAERLRLMLANRRQRLTDGAWEMAKLYGLEARVFAS